MENFDIIIIGAGPAGLTSGIYAGRAGRSVLILDKGKAGGRAALTESIVNYPGIESISGEELMKSFRRQAESFGAVIRRESVKDIAVDNGIKKVICRKHEYTAKAVIIASGMSPRKLGIQGEEKLTGLGVAYCAACDAEFFKGQTVAVVGSGDQAIEESEHIARYADKVMIIVLHDKGELDCNKIAAQRAFENPKLSFIWNSAVTEIHGENSVRGITLKNLKTGTESLLDCRGIFMFVGAVPNTGFVKDILPDGYIETDERTATALSGIFAAGDVRKKALRQISTAVSDGAIAASMADRYLTETEDIESIIKSSCQKEQRLIFWSSEYGNAPEAVVYDNCDTSEIDSTKNPYISKYFGVSDAALSENIVVVSVKDGMAKVL